MKEKDDFYCATCGKFLFTEERESFASDIKCTAGSYDNAYYDGKEDIFYCKKCALKNGFTIA